MIRDITIGQYYPGESWVHKLDARIKIVATLLYIVALFVVHDFIGFAIAFVALAAVIIVSKVPLKFILRGLKLVFLILAFTLILNLFMIQGEVLVHIGIFHKSDDLQTCCLVMLKITCKLQRRSVDIRLSNLDPLCFDLRCQILQLEFFNNSA